ncbi:MAG: FkbM family methyltransferase [Anaerolineae bacterium]|jgi:FkbM family methyltransferase
MEKHISSGCAAYDIGANYGVHTLLMAKLVGPLGHVYAFEPVPEIMACLRENVRLNRFSNVTCVELALGDWTGSSGFARGTDSSSGRLLGPGSPPGGDLSVGVTTLDEFVLGEGHRAPCLVKIDVEGAESRVLSGAERVLQAFHPTLLIDLHNPTEDVAVGGILLDLGYVAVRTCDGCKVRDLTRGWPETDGLWGQVIAFHRGSEEENWAHS